MRNLTIFIILSILVHLSSYKGLEVAASLWGVPAFITDLTEIEIVEEEPQEEPNNLDRTKEKPIVKQLNPIDPIDSRQEARFESEKDQRVMQETKARDFGLTQNESPQTAATPPTPPALNAKGKLDSELDEPGGELPEFARHLQSNPFGGDRSKVSLDLPSDIQFSDATNLNTDANIYYSFYNRVEELFRVRWEQRLNHYWDRLAFEFKRDRLAGKVWSTTLEVTLNANGEYQKALVIQSSNYRPFDEAAIFAFRDARYFPNVPKAKVESDGLVRLRYRFNVHIGPIR